jgi:hypothetical protein
VAKTTQLLSDGSSKWLAELHLVRVIDSQERSTKRLLDGLILTVRQAGVIENK